MPLPQKTIDELTAGNVTSLLLYPKPSRSLSADVPLTAEDIEAIIPLIPHNHGLEQMNFDLPGEKSANNVGNAVAAAPFLLKLELGGDSGLGDLSQEAFEILAAAIADHPRLEKLHISGFTCFNNFSHREQTPTDRAGVTALIQAMGTNQYLKSIEIGSSHLGAQAIADLAYTMRAHLNLLELNVSNNDIDTAAANELAVMLCSIPTLATLNMSGSHDAGDTGMHAIADAVVIHPNLTKLGAARTGMTATSAPILQTMLQQSPALRELNISNNALGDTGIIAVANTLGEANTRLVTLGIAGTGMTANSAARLAHQLKKNKVLQHLNVATNALGDEGLCAIATALKKNKSLTSLSLFDCEYGTDGIRALLEALRENRTLTVLDMNTGTAGVVGIVRIHDSNDRIEAAETTAFNTLLTSGENMTLCHVSGIAFTDAAQSVLKRNSSLRDALTAAARACSDVMPEAAVPSEEAGSASAAVAEIGETPELTPDEAPVKLLLEQPLQALNKAIAQLIEALQLKLLLEQRLQTLDKAIAQLVEALQSIEKEISNAAQAAKDRLTQAMDECYLRKISFCEDAGDIDGIFNARMTVPDTHSNVSEIRMDAFRSKYMLLQGTSEIPPFILVLMDCLKVDNSMLTHLGSQFEFNGFLAMTDQNSNADISDEPNTTQQAQQLKRLCLIYLGQNIELLQPTQTAPHLVSLFSPIYASTPDEGAGAAETKTLATKLKDFATKPKDSDVVQLWNEVSAWLKPTQTPTDSTTVKCADGKAEADTPIETVTAPASKNADLLTLVGAVNTF